MVFASDTLPPAEQLRDRWGWFAALGILMLVAGFIALISVVLATVVSVIIVGAMMIVSGIFEIIHGFQMRRWSRAVLWIVIGALYVVAGLLAVWNPLLASVALTLLIGLFLIVAGVMRVVLAMQMRSASPWGWVLASGIVTILLGAIILLHWPVSSLYVLGILLGVDLIIAGASWLGAAFAFRRIA